MGHSNEPYNDFVDSACWAAALNSAARNAPTLPTTTLAATAVRFEPASAADVATRETPSPTSAAEPNT